MTARREALLLLAGTLAGVALFALAEQRIAGVWAFPLDDTYIHLQIARNLSQGQGFSFYPGEPTAASSAPLWTCVLALLFFFPWDIIYSAKALGAFLLWGCGLLTAALVRQAGLGRNWALLGGLAVVFTPRLLWAALSGMEVGLCALLAVAGIYLHGRCPERSFSLGATTCMALAAAARPECLILFPLALLDTWRGAGWRGLARLSAKPVLLYLLLLAPFALFNLRASGRLLPNTYYAKVGDYGLVGALRAGDMSRIAKALLLYPFDQARDLAIFAAENGVLLAALAPLGLFALVLARRKGGSSWLIPLVLVGYPVLRGLLAPFKGATFQHGRYAAFLVPLLAVAGLAGLRLAWELAIRGAVFPQIQRLRRWGRPVVWLLVLGNALVFDLREARTYGQNVDNIHEMHVSMGRWLAANTAADAVLAASDIGAIAYYSGRRVLDVVGLATPRALDFLQPGQPADGGVLRFLQETRPDYLVILPNWYPRLAQMEEYWRPVHQVVLEDNTIAGGDRLVAYRTRWQGD